MSTFYPPNKPHKVSWILGAILWAIGIVIAFSSTAPIKAVASLPYFKVMSWALKTDGGVNATQMVNGRRYAKAKNVYIQYYGHYVVGSYPGSAIDATCKLYVGNPNNMVSVELDSYSTDTYHGEASIKIVCKDSDTFELQEGKNTIYVGGAVVFQGIGVIPYPAKYDALEYYYDSTKPELALEVTRTPTSKCTQSAAESKSQECWLGIRYKAYDPNDGRLKYVKLYKAIDDSSFQLWKTIDLSSADGNWHQLTYNMKTLGKTQPGTYNVKFRLVAEDEVGNSNSTDLTVAATIYENPATPTPTVAPSVTSTQEPEQQVSSTLSPTVQQSDGSKPTQTQTEGATTSVQSDSTGRVTIDFRDPRTYAWAGIIVLLVGVSYYAARRFKIVRR